MACKYGTVYFTRTDTLEQWKADHSPRKSTRAVNTGIYQQDRGRFVLGRPVDMPVKLINNIRGLSPAERWQARRYQAVRYSCLLRLQLDSQM